MLLFIILLSIIIILSLISLGLSIFVSKVLKNNLLLLSRVLIGLLVLQFVLGMLANLFASIPQVEPWLVFHQIGYISAHTINALIILILAVLYCIKTSQQKQHITFALIGLIGVIVAFSSGVIFVNAGQNNIFSFTMALGFITALLAYASQAFSNNTKKG